MLRFPLLLAGVTSVSNGRDHSKKPSPTCVRTRFQSKSVPPFEPGRKGKASAYIFEIPMAHCWNSFRTRILRRRSRRPTLSSSTIRIDRFALDLRTRNRIHLRLQGPIPGEDSMRGGVRQPTGHFNLKSKLVPSGINIRGAPNVADGHQKDYLPKGTDQPA